MEAIEEKYLKAVAFLCSERDERSRIYRVPSATAFFIRIPIENSQHLAVDYAVTARHCIDEADKRKKLYLRLNRSAGGFIELPTDPNDWYLHDSADVASIPILRDVLPSDVKPEDLDTASLKHSDFVGGSPDYKFAGETPYGWMEFQPRVGHQVYMLGLFTEHYGEERNLPIARFGNIARMPNWVQTETSRTVAYLVEFHSWGGHSGSPVFYMYPFTLQKTVPIKRTDGKQLDVLEDARLMWATSFMGLISGHYPKKQQAETEGDILGKIQIELNTGIAIVTPAEAVTQLLMRPDLIEHRKELKKTADSQRPIPRLDLAKNEE